MNEDVKGNCPSCRRYGGLFLGSGGYVTCSHFDCPNPGAASDLLMGEHIRHFGVILTNPKETP